LRRFREICAISAFFSLRAPAAPIESLYVCPRRGADRESFVTLTCPTCGNDRNFQVKTLQMHVVHLEDGRVEVSEESRPAVLEVLCDECETALKFEEFEDTLRKEVLLTIGAR
jgi:hypothetical protein